MRPIALSVEQYMTRGPYVVGPKEPLGNARRLMEKYSIRHLPVRGDGKLVGILSDRDVQTVWMLADAPHEVLTVEDAMTAEPYTVTPDATLDVVARAMATKRIDSAVVVEDGRVVGVFTSTDAMLALADVLEGKLARSESRVRAASPRPVRGQPAR